MAFRPLAWLRSLHAKLFILTALITSVLMVAVVFSITRNSQREIETYTKKLLIEAADSVETEVVERDPTFKDPRKLEEMLNAIAGPDRSIFQVDVFKRVGKDELELFRSSGEEDLIEWGPELRNYLNITEPMAELVDLNTGGRAWKVYYPIRNAKLGRPTLGLIRAYIDLERWEEVWKANRQRTILLLPGVLAGEFILLWLLLRVLISDPIASLTSAMNQLEQGDASARSDVRRKDELGLIATRFNAMASRLQRAGAERESLISEIKGLNTGLQTRIDEALEELQMKNQELAAQVGRNALLREELSVQERLAVAGQVTATFAHEVGTPLNLVNGHLQLLQQSELPEKTKERLGVIQAQIQRVGDIVRRLLDLTRRPQMAFEPVSMNQLMDSLYNLWAPTFAAHNVELAVDLPEPCDLRADRKQLEQLLINLANNAVDAMPKGGLLSVRALPDQEEPGFWRVDVRDTGSGISEANLSHVFRPMFTTKPEGKGTGLGLPICREIVRAHGGEIRIESSEGKGTAVIFTLPMVTA